MSIDPHKDIKLYCEYMEDIKLRIAIIKNFITGPNTFGSEMHDYEIACLHLRKILELIIFANLTANKIEYSRVHDNFFKHRGGSRLLKNIEKINPNFYPVPLGNSKLNESGVRHFENIEHVYLTQENWIELYNLCSSVIHVWNPYTKIKREINFGKPILEWIQHIQKLLNTHYVKLAGTNNLWLVMMEYPEDKKVHAFAAEAVSKNT